MDISASIVGVGIVKACALPSQAALRELLRYDPETGIFTWRSRGKKHQLWDNKNAGKIAGNVSKNGYIRITIRNKNYWAHRLAWVYVYGAITKLDVDHENLIKTDNRISNLRLATRSQNHANKPSRVGSLPRGVARNHKRYLAQISVARKYIYLGTFDTPEQAHANYVAAAKKYYGEFARFD